MLQALTELMEDAAVEVAHRLVDAALIELAERLRSKAGVLGLGGQGQVHLRGAPAEQPGLLEIIADQSCAPVRADRRRRGRRKGSAPAGPSRAALGGEGVLKEQAEVVERVLPGDGLVRHESL